MARTSAETTGRGSRRIQLAAVERGTPRSRKSNGVAFLADEVAKAVVISTTAG
jgi:hypothetical protein